MKFLILGAGAAGLSFANALKLKGESSFLVIERESEAGGLCRSVEVDGAPIDIGGGHFLDVRRPKVNEFLFHFMPETEWNKFSRISKISLNGNYIDHPIEANIWLMPQSEQVEYLKSIAIAGCNIGKQMPSKFTEWIYWKLGKKIADEYMIPYNQKMFGDELNLLGTYWLDKLPNVSFDETLLSCLDKKPYGSQPGHAEFYYPKKYGYGELWKRMANNISQNILYKKTVHSIDFNTKTVTTEDGNEYKADCIITSIPWTSINNLVGMPDEIRTSVKQLKHTSVQIEYIPDKLDTKAHWIYYPDLKLTYHRILVRGNFYINGKGYWTETNLNRVSDERNTKTFSYINKYAYPLNTISKPDIMKKLLGWCKNQNVYAIGRWGEHNHYNSDQTVELAIKMVDKIIN